MSSTAKAGVALGLCGIVMVMMAFFAFVCVVGLTTVLGVSFIGAVGIYIGTLLVELLLINAAKGLLR